MFSENIINLNWCIITKMPVFRVDKFSAGRTKCRSPKDMVEQFSTIPINLQWELKPYFGLDLIDPRSSSNYIQQLQSQSPKQYADGISIVPTLNFKSRDLIPIIKFIHVGIYPQVPFSQGDLIWGSIPKVIFLLNPVLFMSLYGHAMSN